MSDAHPPAEPMALLSAFLDGELNAADEAALLRRLEQEPALQDALDALAETMAAAQSALHHDLDPEDDIDVLSAVMAGLAAKDVADTVEGTETLVWLVADGAADAEQALRLNTLLNQYPDEAAEALAFVDAARATLCAPADVMQAALARLPDHIGARVARAERGWALSAGAADGALSAAELEELVGLASNDDGLAGSLAGSLEAAIAARVNVDGVDRAVTEALLAFAGSPEVDVLAARAGAAALQAIAAEAAQQTTAAAKTTTTTTTAAATSVWAKLRSALTQGWLPLAAAGAAAVAFMVVDRDGDVATDTIAAAAVDQAAKLAEFREAFVKAVEPVAMANNTTVVDSAALPMLADNGADVETLDAAGNTMVFQTAESNITIIWVAGLDDDEAEEQGT